MWKCLRESGFQSPTISKDPVSCKAHFNDLTAIVAGLQSVDLLLFKWNNACRLLEAAEQTFVDKGKKERPQTRVGGCCCCGGTAPDCVISV